LGTPVDLVPSLVFGIHDVGLVPLPDPL